MGRRPRGQTNDDVDGCCLLSVLRHGTGIVALRIGKELDAK